MGEGDVRRRIVISGRVQGVWFRESCRGQAIALGVAGWVRNRADGTVEGVFEGPLAAVERLVTWCLAGPSQARVDAVATTDETPVGVSGFRVR